MAVCNADLDILRHGAAELVLEVFDQVIRVLADMGTSLRGSRFESDVGDKQKPGSMMELSLDLARS